MSAILSADDLNDFISPGVACIKPIETLPAAKSIPSSDLYEVTTEDSLLPSDLPPAQISLTDCLACSGCVTSAEAVLVSLQSHTEVLQALDSTPSIRLSADSFTNGIQPADLQGNGRIFVASVSPQTRASIAATYKVSEREAGYMIEQLLAGPHGLQLGGKYGNSFQWVVDTNVAREVCLVAGAEEVVASMQKNFTPRNNDVSSALLTKPILTSSCPGWICYAEKTHPHVLPHLSRLKSPQALMGTFLKTILGRKLGVSPDRIWHVAIMPCFDKKLEASRQELTDLHWETNSDRSVGIRDVDCVITSKELLMLAEMRGIEMSSLPRSPIPTPQQMAISDPLLQNFLFYRPRFDSGNGSPEAGTSGGNLYYILQYFASQNPGSSIQTSRGRNADVLEYTLVSASGETIVKAARYYGFRNIQNLVRRLKPARQSRMPGSRPLGNSRKPGNQSTGPDYAYVEVMACPGGCTNGGGNIRADDAVVTGRPNGEVKYGPQEHKNWLALVDEAYFSGEEDDAMDLDVPLSGNAPDVLGGTSPSRVHAVLNRWMEVTGLPVDKLLYTTYREVVSDVGKGKSGEVERVVELASKIGGGW